MPRLTAMASRSPLSMRRTVLVDTRSSSATSFSVSSIVSGMSYPDKRPTSARKISTTQTKFLDKMLIYLLKPEVFCFR